MRIVYSSQKCSCCSPAIFIDRDGVINNRRAGDYVLNWSQFVFMAGIRNALKRLALLELPIIVISNQSAVGRGLLTRSTLEEMTGYMREALLADGVPLKAVYYCLHKPDDRCSCRKPEPKMLYRAALDFNLDLSASVFIGDSDADTRAAQLAGCKPILFGPGLTECSESLEWKSRLPVARTADELYAVATDVLRSGFTREPSSRAGVL